MAHKDQTKTGHKVDPYKASHRMAVGTLALNLSWNGARTIAFIHPI